MTLDLTSLEKSVLALQRSVVEGVPCLHELSPALRDTLKSGVIQHFEVAYEQSWKAVKRWLEYNVGTEAVDGVPRRELYRHAAEHHLIEDVEHWMGFHRARNETSHTYSSDTAEEVYAVAVAFLPAALALLTALRTRN
jgi:nucleotidyltransferase substrate binding protein (TIGR01987 family)